MRAARRFAAGVAAAVTATAGLLAGAGLAGLGSGVADVAVFPAFVGPQHAVSTVASTVPGNGDVNPYGTAVVPRSVGGLSRGSVLVSNFNDQANVQGTGTTIVQVSPAGGVSLFARVSPRLPGCPGGAGLTTALSVLSSGWVIVGSLPTQDGSISGTGCLIVLDSHGVVRETFTGHGIRGPWDMTAAGFGATADLFVADVLNGNVLNTSAEVDAGSVLRLTLAIPAAGLPRIADSDTIGSGFPEQLNSAVLIVGPTGVGLGPDGALYVADTLDSRVARIPDAVTRGTSAGTGFTVSQGGHLNGELGLAIAPGGDILTVNGGDGNLVEITPSGRQVAVRALDTSGSPPGAGALFGLAVAPDQRAVYFVDDAANTLDLLHH
jgi:hypothetical protein